MEKYIVAEERKLKDTPNSIIEKGISNFGSFLESFNDINLLDVHKQSKYLPDFLNARRLTEWEAFELDFNKGTLVSAVYNNMHLNGMGILVYYDKEEDKIYSYRVMTNYRKAHIANNLIDSESYIKTNNFELRIINDFKNKKAKIKANMYNKKNGKFSMDLEIEQFAPSSIVSIPLGVNKPLYSEKAIFKATGKLNFKNVEYDISDNASAIIDDHKGYYPYKAHYDWLTTMGMISHNGELKKFGFNLTKNQSINENKYNENNIWIDGKFYYLPPVTFKHLGDKWFIKDEYDNVNLEFTIKKTYKMITHALIIDIKYYLPFGYINGYVRNEDGEKFVINNMIGIAEDKTTRL